MMNAKATNPLLRSAFRRLDEAHAVSALGTALSSGALPLVAVTLLDAAAWRVSALAALAGIASALIALPMGAPSVSRR